MAKKSSVCVTGAGGFAASWLVKLLLSKGYTVHGTVRDPRVAILRVQTDVFMPNDLDLLIGDEKYAHLTKIGKPSDNLKLFEADLLDYNSLFAAIKECSGVFHVASPIPSSNVPDTESWYYFAKTSAEIEALDFAKRSGLDFATVCPTLILGPRLQSTLNATSAILVGLLKEGYNELEIKVTEIVDVRDLAEALLLTHEKARSGRKIHMYGSRN